MFCSNPGLAILILCVSILSWTVSRSAAQGVPASELPQDVCGKPVLRNPIRCGCFGYRQDLEDPEWSLLRQECNNTLNGNIDAGEGLCVSLGFTSSGGSIEFPELNSFFNNTFVTCAVPLFGLDYPGSTPGPSVKFIDVSQGRRETKFEHYFSGHADVPFHPAVHMALSARGRRRTRNFCYTVAVFHRRNSDQNALCG